MSSEGSPSLESSTAGRASAARASTRHADAQAGEASAAGQDAGRVTAEQAACEQAACEQAACGPSHSRAALVTAARAGTGGADATCAPVLVALLADVRSTVTAYADRRREAGASVQRMLPEVKALVREAVSGDAGRDVAETLMPWVVRWSIEAYDAPPEAPRGGPCGGDRAPRPA